MLKFKIVLCFLLLFSSLALAGIWVTQYENSTGPVLNRVYFVDARVGYAVGNSGLLLKTTNHGRDWSTITLSGVSANLYGIQVIGSNIYLAAGDGKFYKVNDSGTILSSAQVSSVALSDIWAADANNLFISGRAAAGQEIFRSSDGGSNWTSSSAFGVDVWSANGSSSREVWFSANGGSAFYWNGSSLTTYTMFAAHNYTANLMGIYNRDANNAITVGDYQAAATGNAFLTTNGGTNWSKMNIGGGAVNLSDIYFIDANRGWIVGEGGRIYSTTSGGATAASWTAETSGATANLWGVFATDANNVWAVGGASSLILKYVVSPEALTVTPTSAAQGATSVITIEGTNFQGTAGSTTDAPSLSLGSGVNVNSVTFNSATSISANISVSSGAVEGTRDVTVTNPDGGVGVKSSGFRVTAASAAPETPGSSPTTSETVVSSPQVNSPGATINVSFQLSSARSLVVQILNQSGAVVARLVHSGSAGANQLEIPSAGLPAGVYLYQIIADGAVQSQGWFVIER